MEQAESWAQRATRGSESRDLQAAHHPARALGLAEGGSTHPCEQQPQPGEMQIRRNGVEMQNFEDQVYFPYYKSNTKYIQNPQYEEQNEIKSRFLTETIPSDILELSLKHHTLISQPTQQTGGRFTPCHCTSHSCHRFPVRIKAARGPVLKDVP